MATINDELNLKTQELQMQLAIANSLVDAKRDRYQGFIEANLELLEWLKDKELESKD